MPILIKYGRLSAKERSVYLVPSLSLLQPVTFSLWQMFVLADENHAERGFKWGSLAGLGKVGVQGNQQSVQGLPRGALLHLREENCLCHSTAM